MPKFGSAASHLVPVHFLILNESTFKDRKKRDVLLLDIYGRDIKAKPRSLLRDINQASLLFGFIRQTVISSVALRNEDGMRIRN